MAPTIEDSYVDHKKSVSTQSSCSSRPESMSAWMHNGKSSLLDYVLRKDRRVFLTLDFDAQILCIHKSTPLSFEDILAVEFLPGPHRSSSSLLDGKEASRCHLPSWRAPKTITQANTPATGFLLTTMSGKKIRLTCSSVEECTRWVAALQIAVKGGQTTSRQDSATLLSTLAAASHQPEVRTFKAKSRKRPMPLELDI